MNHNANLNHNTNDTYDFDRYDEYEEQFDPITNSRQMRRQGKHKSSRAPKPAPQESPTDFAEAVDLENEFNISYQPSRYEAGWLVDTLRPFYEQTLIADVLALVRGGKEATVYCCEAHPSVGLPLLAAKVYRPRKFRSLRNDAVYREGRQILTAEGRAVKNNDHRVMRAIGKKSAFGVEVAQTSWLMYEFKTLQALHAMGAAVPRPVAVGEHGVLMGYYGDAEMPAPTLNEVRLDRDEAALLLAETLRNVELMLSHGLIHGDLSAYNILYWEGEIVLIDFPQVIDSRNNPQSYQILRRDVTRVCEYFQRQGAPSDPTRITDALWAEYVNLSPADWLDVLPEDLDDDEDAAR
ncbi:RIO1 family regulatory kinase/ATPase domain-containing protein [Aggregatilinea lenta]|uniref:RIO1 family regulatory kinase/ATPase domain-containing protein n=1 Tax=Aggregatilinea lenta TaxID=913108 RepID=UPI000E5A4FFB|nr:RIO1 family regulatory kinase/ATPase [Aggregatilinea lenta]